MLCVFRMLCLENAFSIRSKYESDLKLFGLFESKDKLNSITSKAKGLTVQAKADNQEIMYDDSDSDSGSDWHWDQSSDDDNEIPSLKGESESESGSSNLELIDDLRFPFQPYDAKNIPDILGNGQDDDVESPRAELS